MKVNQYYSSKWVNGDMVVSIKGITDTITFSVKTMSEAFKAAAFAYGLDVRANRLTAIPNDTTSGKPASAQARWNKVNRYAQHANSGTVEWEMRQSAEDRAAQDAAKKAADMIAMRADVAIALIAVKGMTATGANAWVTAHLDDDIVKMRAHPTIAKAIIDHYAGQSAPDLDSMIGTIPE